MSFNDISVDGYPAENEAKSCVTNSKILLLKTGLFLLAIKRKKESLFLVLMVVNNSKI